MDGLNATCVECNKTAWQAGRDTDSCSICSQAERKKFKIICHQIWRELQRAKAKHTPMPSTHHGIAVIRGECLELENEVYKEKSEQVNEPMLDEAIQVAAMGVRFVMDLGGGVRY
jgi:hypothetical protein